MPLFRDPRPVLLYILHSGNLYGTERMALATLEGMDEYETRVVAAPKPSSPNSPSVTAAARERGYATITFHTRTQLLRGLLPWFLRHRAIDVIGVGVGSSLMCHALSRVLFVRLRQLQVAHGGTEDWHAYGRKHLLNRIPVAMVAVSDFVRQKLLDHGVRREAIRVIDNFLSPSQRRELAQRGPFDPSQPGARPLDARLVRVAVVSRVDPIKRLDVLVDALERHGLGGFDFDVYGTGDDFERLRGRTAHLNNITFHGFVADVKSRLAEADLLLHLCPEEPFGLVVLEAFASRIVPIVPASGGAGSLVADGHTGWHFRPNDADDLARALERARAASPDEWQRLADAGGQALDERFGAGEGVRRYREALRVAGDPYALGLRRGAAT